jgi:hypothetical protein
MTPRETILDLRQRVGRSIIGQEQIVELVRGEEAQAAAADGAATAPPA